MATQLFTSTVNSALGYSTQHEVVALCDGSLAVIASDGSAAHLYQVTTPTSAPTATSVQTFNPGAVPVVASLYVVNTGMTSSDVWVTYSYNGATTGDLFVAHGTYTASGATWTWDNTGTKVTTTAQYLISTLVWTGTYLILAYRHYGASSYVYANATATKSGASGWGTEYQLAGSGGSQSHAYVTLLHDATNACTLAVYSVTTGVAGHDSMAARVIADATAPTAVANWSAEVSLSGNINVGAANLTAVCDPANKNLHIAWCNSAASPNPVYVVCTYTTTAITAGTSFSITGGGGTTATSPMLAIDAATPTPTAYLFWASAASGAASDISYVTIVSPYASANVSAITNLTNASANDNVFPQTPRNAVVSGYVPLLYQYSAATPYGVWLDTSITASSGGGGSVTGTLAFSGQGALAIDGVVVGVGNLAFTGQGALSVTAVQVITGAAAFSGQGALSVAPFTPGTGIGDITRSTGTQTANKSGNGYGVGDITGTEYDYAYKDATGSGWAVGANPWYGGMPISAWYQLDPTLNTTLPQQTSATGNLMSLLTTQSGGIVHWEEAVGGTYAASELPTFSAGGNFTELAPASTAFRAYIKAAGDAADANGISWTAYACIYPGDPGLVVFRFDQHNGTASAISVDESDVELIASLLTDTGQNPTGIWSRANGFIGTIGAAPTVGWPAAGVHQTGTFDYLGVTPDTGNGISLGTGAAVIADPSVQFSWALGGYEANDSGVTTTPGRIKIGFYSGVTTAWNIPAGQTNTYYVLRAFRRNLTATDMAAIAADFKYPGTPTTTAGSFTTFAVDERAYAFAASGNALSATLDLSPANVTARFKPVIKVTGWTDTSAPVLTWGGAALTAGTDYRVYNDTATSTLYVQLYCDVVASGAVAGQRNNAALTIAPSTLTAAAAFSGQGALSVTGVQVVTAAVAFTGDGALSVGGVQVVTAALAFTGDGALAVTGVQVVTASVAFTGDGALSVDGAQAGGGAAVFSGQGALAVTGVQVITAAVAFSGQGALSVAPLLALYAALAFSGQGALVISVAPPPKPSGVSVALGGGAPVGVSVALGGGAPVGVSVALGGGAPVGVSVAEG